MLHALDVLIPDGSRRSSTIRRPEAIDFEWHLRQWVGRITGPYESSAIPAGTSPAVSVRALKQSGYDAYLSVYLISLTTQIILGKRTVGFTYVVFRRGIVSLTYITLSS